MLLSPLWYFDRGLPAPLSFALCLLSSDCRALLGFPSIVCTWTLPLGRKLSSQKIHLVCFPLVSVQCPLLRDEKLLKTIGMFYLDFSCLRQEGKSVPFYFVKA